MSAMFHFLFPYVMFSANHDGMQRSVAADWFYWLRDHLIWHWSFPVLSGHTEQSGRRQGLTKRKRVKNPGAHTEKKEGNSLFIFFLPLQKKRWAMRTARFYFGFFNYLIMDSYDWKNMEGMFTLAMTWHTNHLGPFIQMLCQALWMIYDPSLWRSVSAN